ncbi:hypothetical protein [Streptomyces sp. NPDC005760]|uniref:hypothetical protein n=1 Tax=Streptomyces sp. NPDC005760 TaxID=3156718 RepID=UPI0033C0A463
MPYVARHPSATRPVRLWDPPQRAGTPTHRRGRPVHGDHRRELRERTDAIAAEWRKDTQDPVRPRRFVAICGFANVDYTAPDLACLRLGAATLPLPANPPLVRLPF